MFRPSIVLDADDLTGAFQTTRKIDSSTIRQKVQYDNQGRPTATPKLVDGRPVYGVPVQYVDDDGVDASVHLAVMTPPVQEIPALSRIRPVGAVLVVPYMDERTHRMAWSLTADSVCVTQIDVAPIAAPLGEDDDE